MDPVAGNTMRSLNLIFFFRVHDTPLDSDTNACPEVFRVCHVANLCFEEPDA